MIQVLLPFLTAIGLSGIAAYYSVIGLAQIFPGSYWPIIIMGSVLEASKLVTVSWLYNNWSALLSIECYYSADVDYFNGNLWISFKGTS